MTVRDAPPLDRRKFEATQMKNARHSRYVGEQEKPFSCFSSLEKVIIRSTAIYLVLPLFAESMTKAELTVRFTRSLTADGSDASGAPRGPQSVWRRNERPRP